MKKILVVVLVLVVLILTGVSYYWYRLYYASDTSQEAIPVISVNPLENKPDINPINQANPFNNIKTNPFE